MNKIVKIGVFALFEFASIFSAVARKPINTGDALKDSAAMANRRTGVPLQVRWNLALLTTIQFRICGT